MKIGFGKPIKYLLLAGGALAMVAPFLWMVSTSLKSPLEVLSSQIRLVPSLKKYVEYGGSEEQVEFAWEADLRRELSLGEGGIVASLGPASGEAAVLAGAFKRYLEGLPDVFLEFDSRVAAGAGLDALWNETLGKAAVGGAAAESLAALKRTLDEVGASARYRQREVEVVVIGGEFRGRRFEVAPEKIIYRRLLWSNYVRAWLSAPFGRYFLNSIVMSLGVTAGQILTSALAAYAFARMRFRFKEGLFMILLATMMVPKQVILIPDYAILSSLHWINTYYVLIVPFIAAVFGIYFLRQHFETLPQDLFDAASIDGCSQLRTLFQIVLPLSKGVLITVSLFTFIMTWNSLLWPLVMTNTPEMRPLQVGLAVFNQESGTEWELLMAASTFSILPLLAIFFLAQKQFIEGITRSGMKD